MISYLRRSSSYRFLREIGAEKSTLLNYKMPENTGKKFELVFYSPNIAAEMTKTREIYCLFLLSPLMQGRELKSAPAGESHQPTRGRPSRRGVN